MEVNEGEIQPIELNLNMANEKTLNEFNPFTMFGSAVKLILKGMFGGSSIPVNIRGNSRQVNSFAKTLASEKKYVQTAAKYGLDNPRTYKDKFKLNGAIKKFERATGLKWPVK
jgi:hypothetical protein